MKKLQIIYINDNNNTIIITSNINKYIKLFNKDTKVKNYDRNNFKNSSIFNSNH